jgi:sec-independent protein translocase protein TatB
MLDFNMSEMMVVAIVALLVIGPKDLPKAMRFVGYWVGRARGVARQFRSGFDAMVREAELAEMEKKWAEENARIMREHPAEPEATALPAPNAAAGTDPNADPLAITDPVEPASPDVPAADAPITDHPAIEPKAQA